MKAPRPAEPSDFVATELFGGCAEATIEMLRARSTVRALKRQQILFSEGDQVEGLAVVRSGRLKIFATSNNGDELLLSIVEPGETLGELGLLDGTGRSATAEAMESSEVVLVPREDVLGVLAKDQEFAHRMHARISALARRLTTSSTDLAFLDLPRRLAKALLVRHATGTTGSGLSLSQSDLAALVGGSRQAVNAALANFERRGWVKRESGRVVSIDAAGLRRFADG